MTRSGQYCFSIVKNASFQDGFVTKFFSLHICSFFMKVVVEMKTALQEELALDMSHFTGGYGRIPILKDLSFQVKEGESVAFVGENGAGKATFFRAILQLLSVQYGSITILGRPILSNQDKRWAWSCIGYVPQSMALC